MEIKNVDLTHMNNGAHYSYVKNAAGAAKANELVNTKALAQVLVLQEKVAAEDEALKLTQKSFITDEIKAKDKERGKLYSAYRKAVKSHLNAPVADMAEAAKVLDQSIKDYKIDPKMQIDRETGLLDNLLTDHQGKYAEYVATLGLTSYTTAMREANDKVNSLLQERAKERAAQVSGALRTARTATDTAYKKLVKKVNALMLINGDDGYAEFINYMNEEIERYQREVLTSKKRKQNADNDGGDETK